MKINTEWHRNEVKFKIRTKVKNADFCLSATWPFSE